MQLGFLIRTFPVLLKQLWEGVFKMLPLDANHAGFTSWEVPRIISLNITVEEDALLILLIISLPICFPFRKQIRQSLCLTVTDLAQNETISLFIYSRLSFKSKSYLFANLCVTKCCSNERETCLCVAECNMSAAQSLLADAPHTLSAADSTACRSIAKQDRNEMVSESIQLQV